MAVRSMKDGLIKRDLSENKFVGGIPAEIGNLVNTRWLYELLINV
jgi:hypothetical protein